MEEWKLEFEWLRVRHLVRQSLGKDKLPDLNAVLFLIGIQELGRWESDFSKEEKQDLMHVAVCSLLSRRGYYSFEGRDADGWPHWKSLRPVTTQGVKEQGELLKLLAIEYFEDWRKEQPDWTYEEE